MELKKIQNFFNVKILEGNYDVKRWFENVKGLEKEREGGKRCEICYKIRLEETAKKARSLGINVITTTLTVSPWKNSKKIFQIGRNICTGQAGAARVGDCFPKPLLKKRA